MIPIEWRWAYRGQSESTSLAKKQPKKRSDLQESRHRGEPDAGCSRSKSARNGTTPRLDG
jgi:hypothetical protein